MKHVWILLGLAATGGLLAACAGSRNVERVSVEGIDVEVWRSGDRLHVRVSWPDATKDVVHKPWKWNAAVKAYEKGAEREDMVELYFLMSGSREMLGGEESVWDDWHWKAFRTNPAGFAIDKTHRYFKSDPGGDSHPYEAKGGATVWATREEDAGTNVQKKLPAPDEFRGDAVPSFGYETPSGSVGDVHAKGAWENGRWTVEFERALDTGHDDDVIFSASKSFTMGVCPFDGKGHREWTPAEVRVFEIRLR